MDIKQTVEFSSMKPRTAKEIILYRIQPGSPVSLHTIINVKLVLS